MVDFKALLEQQRLRQETEVPDPLESVIEEKVGDYADLFDIWHCKFTSVNRRSVPDRIFITPKGTVFWIEFKRRGKDFTEQQLDVATEMRDHNAKVFLCDSIESGKQIIDEILMWE